MWKRAIVLPGLIALASPAAAQSKCEIGKMLELPVQLGGRRAIVTANIGGKEARFILDSGAFYSNLSRASATEYGLTLTPAPFNFRLQGLNGSSTASTTTVHNFGLGGVTLPRVDFLVGGTDTGTVGLLGQNILGVADVEYDLPHGMIRLMKSENCGNAGLAYWAGTRPVTVVTLEPRTPPFRTHTIGTVMLNGVKLRALFDTGAQGSILTLAAAKRAGMTPDTAGVVAAGSSTGLGSRVIRTWLGTFDKLDIGGEAIAKPKIMFGDVQIGDADMLIGIDFFMTHRLYVANKAQRMYVTYEGGPMFGLRPTGAVTSDGKAIDLTDTSGEPTDADGYARRGSVLASNGKIEPALADFDKAVALAPNQARFLRLRAAGRIANHQPLLALDDINKAIALDPADAEARMVRAQMKLAARDPAGALDDLHVADKGLPPTSEQRLRLGAMFGVADDYETAITNFDSWLKSHPEDARRPTALNGRCWARALLNRDLDRALDDCNAAVRQRPNDAAYLDSRALVEFRRGSLDKALADYDNAVSLAPRNAWSLYARGLLKAKTGDAAGAKADKDAALAIQPAVAARARKFGLES